MVKPAEKVEVEPKVVLLESLLAEVAAGKLRVPGFQRGFVWRPEQMLHLYDSIERGYPIGSVLVWQTGLSLHSQDHVTGISVSPPPAGEPVSYLLDGNQRISTLFGTLSRRPADSDADPRERPWQIYRVLGEGDSPTPGFVYWDGPGKPPASYLPMQAVLRTVDFLRYARRLAEEADNAEELLEEAEQLTQRIRSYQVAVVRLIGGSLAHAIEAFTRLNSAGQQITQLEMVSALTYRPGIAQNLNTRIAGIQERVGAGGFGDLPIETIFQAVLTVAGERDVLDLAWADMARRVQDLLDDAATGAEDALHRAVRFLRYDAGVPLAWLVPYPLQVALLARFFHLVPEPNQSQVRALVRWFWATSWSGALIGADGARVAWAVDQIEEFAAGRGELAVGGHTAQPFPDWFDPDNGRSRAYILWELRTFDRRLDLDGEEIDTVELLATLKASAYRRVLAAEQEWRLSPANHLLLPTTSGTSLLDALVRLPPHLAPAILDSHGIPADGLAQLRAALPPEPDFDMSTEDDQQQIDGELSEAEESGEDTAEAEAAAQVRTEAERNFIRARACLLAERERAFMRELGIEYVTAPTETETVIR